MSTKAQIIAWLKGHARETFSLFLSRLLPAKAYHLTDPAASDNDGFLADFTSVAAVRTDTVFLAPGPAACLAYPRNLTVTTSAALDETTAHPSVLITGTDIDGAALTETISGLDAGGGGTYAGVKAFKTVTSLVWAAGVGVCDATQRVGFANVFGLPARPVERAGKPVIWRELQDGVAATAGTIVAKGTSPPYGSYAPNAAPDAAKDYTLLIEQDTADLWP